MLVELALHRADELGSPEMRYDTQTREGITTMYTVRPAHQPGSAEDG